MVVDVETILIYRSDSQSTDTNFDHNTVVMGNGDQKLDFEWL